MEVYEADQGFGFPPLPPVFAMEVTESFVKQKSKEYDLQCVKFLDISSQGQLSFFICHWVFVIVLYGAGQDLLVLAVLQNV